MSPELPLIDKSNTGQPGINELAGLVSIIIPAFNAALFIDETLDSVLGQSYSNWQAIIVNDGSTDNTTEVLCKRNDPRIRVLNQVNAGVSHARNHGLAQAEGEFIVFFDADDIMTPDFLRTRVDALQKNPAAGFAGGLVETFPEKTTIRRGVSSEAEKEILFYDPACVTIPSNYMFRRKPMVKNALLFNENLASTADRFFLLEISRYSKGINIDDEKGKLLYRVSETSMSNNINLKLVRDAETFYHELKRKNYLPAEKNRFKSFYFFSLALSFRKINKWPASAKYLVMSFFHHPVEFIDFIKRKWRKTRNKPQ